jgi:hypothetical protein
MRRRLLCRSQLRGIRFVEANYIVVLSVDGLCGGASSRGLLARWGEKPKLEKPTALLPEKAPLLAAGSRRAELEAASERAESTEAVAAGQWLAASPAPFAGALGM